MPRAPRRPAAPPRPPPRRALIGAITALLIVAAWIALRPAAPPRPPAAPPIASTDSAPPRPSATALAGPARPPSPRPDRGAPPGGDDPADPDLLARTPEDRRALWEKRLARAQHTLDSYVESTRYPPESRPMREHPDLVAPHHVDPVTLPLARKDEKLTDAKVTLRQDRFFLVGDERATLLVSCETSDGPAPCEIAEATAAVPPSDPGAGARPAVPVHFDPGPDGSLRTEFQPSSQGFAEHHGTIRVSLDLRVDGESGAASFDVQYTPTPPAIFTGKVREALQGGSLDLYLEMTVDRPGRYVITARADDAEGQSFAYLTFNEEIGAGRQEVRLRLFGKLVRDTGARSPFRLRDVEGFRLLENTFPDREIVPSLEGAVHTTKRYRDRDFSESEWQSEERDRHIRELTKDVEVARDNVGKP